MSRTLNEATISTRNARAKLDAGMHWRGLDSDVHLGYRKGKRAGRWLVRWYVGAQRYKQETLATADDVLEADGINCLSFDQAKLASVKFVQQKRAEDIATANGPLLTVRSAVFDYLEHRDARDGIIKKTGNAKSDVRRRLTKHVLGSSPIANTALHSLVEGDLRQWRAKLPAELAPATVRRIINDFKAALNATAVSHRSRLPAELIVVIKNGLATSEAQTPTARDAQALSDNEVRTLIHSAAIVDTDAEWNGDLSRLVLVLAATGARYSQVVRMTVADVQVEHLRLMVPTSRKGRGQKKASHIAIRVGQDVIDALLPAIVGRRKSETLLERWRHKQMPASEGKPPHWTKDARGPWLNASEMSRPWSAIVTAAQMGKDVVPYSLRHSSIVRQLRKGLPVRLVAALHDTSTAMIESHYSAAIVDALDGLAAGAVIPLMNNPDNIVKFRG
ncbi:tyrosine-type recombinase/integrase [Phyllobacterium meliloti]|uniref:tyrosine-type recombinase/integrase n=1 Tax=Phyllobacterium meliloti TaxID=555317 RepID=UPI001D155159|nr:tyrosine-type recombinase/integrase [Phyllobacterium sp. T1293]UGX86180.1 tyrosine-type recombinase/integrase [Phyllobacterium sp. T1293]